jgi:two-component system, OmpR family, manganese sensing sensor histidine kinase
MLMAWANVSGYVKTKVYSSLGWRLWLAYLTSMSIIFGIAAAIAYSFFKIGLNQDQNSRLQTLAQAAVPSLETIKTKGVKSLDKDLPWHNLFEQDQSLEWFDPDGKLLAREGKSFPDIPLAKTTSVVRLNEGSPQIEQKGDIRSVSIAIYTDSSGRKTLRLAGYIRASESVKELSSRLNQFQLGLEIGGVTVLILSGIGAAYLTSLAIQPTKKSFQHLKQFTADASHELRNPLTTIVTATELMQGHSEQLSDDDTKKLTTISSATEQIQHIVEDLRFLSQTDVVVDSSVIEYSKVPLDEILLDLVDTFELQAQNQKLSFESHVSKNVAVKGDIYQLKRLFTNLLDNAIKYTNAGGVVKLILKKQKQFAVVVVEDTGMGIPSEYQPLIFQRFWRADNAHTQQRNGLGLGLAICQAIAQRHLGKIKVYSKLGVGSCFQVYLPLA